MDRKRKKNYYAMAAKKAKFGGNRKLCENMRGFLITVNNREREGVKEAYNLFNEVADELFGPENLQKVENGERGEDKNEEKVEDKNEEKVAIEEGDNSCGDGSEEEDIDSAFDKEKEKLAKERTKQSAERRFQSVESGANNVLFIRTSLEAPDALVERIVGDMAAGGGQRARFILRLVPILGTCKAYDKNMCDLARSVLTGRLPPDTTTTSFCVLFKTRNNNQVKRDDTIKLIATVVKEMNKSAVVDFKNPEIAIVVEIIRNICCIGICRDFYTRKKYNLLELAKPNLPVNEAEVKEEKAPTLGENGEAVKDNAVKFEENAVKFEKNAVKVEDNDVKVEENAVKVEKTAETAEEKYSSVIENSPKVEKDASQTERETTSSP